MDTVLDVEQIAARAVRLGPHVTVVRIPDGLHDLMLSAPHVASRRWMRSADSSRRIVKRG